MKNVLITGGAGFIGSNFVRYFLREHPDVSLVNLDSLTYAGNLESLEDVSSNPHYRFVRLDICEQHQVLQTLREHNIDTIVHFAAESHVDRSISGSEVFVRTNLLGTHALLDAAKDHGIRLFLHVSTDEVYGSLGPSGRFTETTPLHPNSPYAASKAGSDFLALAYNHTHGVPVVVTRCSNNYGPFQFPEKLIPLMIINALNDKTLPVYGDGQNVRDWLYVEDHCSAIDAVLQRGVPGEVYNIGGHNELKNIDIVKLILEHLGKPLSLITFVKDRPGHDRRYAMDAGKIMRDLEWAPQHKFEDGLKSTIKWYIDHRLWWERVISGAYQEYYKMMYEDR